ncbi:putative proton pump-interactor [Lupinus albus]|uniref:Putative proton pump-interactor n=1 Tax=Lupinus albus TaxID=3870 RepID=A0A6A4QSG8_LUPAL|nr:putative proton pump-interactor [Lupinus albus]
MFVQFSFSQVAMHKVRVFFNVPIVGYRVVGAMAGEVAGFEMVQGPVENGAEEDKSILHEKEIGKLERDSEVSDSTIFSSHTDESSAAEENGVSDSSGSKNTGEEGPAPQKIHSFYFIRLRRYDDPNIKPEMDKLDKEMNQKNQIRIQLTDAIREKRVSQEFFRLNVVEMGRQSH